MQKSKIINFIFIFFFLFQTSKVYSNINNSIIISVGNLPITYLDLVKEMKLVSILSNNKIDDSNKEQIKNIAIQSLIKRKIKEIEVTKYNVKNYSKNDLENLISKTAAAIGTDKNGLKKLMERSKVDFERIKKKFEIDLKWNTLIFDLYKNKVSLNMSEIEDKINSEMEDLKPNRDLLLSEIEINLPKDEVRVTINKIMDNIKKEGFENTAKKFSISESATYGGNIGWINEKNLSRKVYENIKNLKVEEIGKPIFTESTIVIIKKNGEKVYEKNIKNIKDKIVRMEKEKKLQMFSNAHYSKLERTTQINFL